MEERFELRKFVAPEFIFGFGARFLFERYLNNFSARKVLVVTDKGIINHGWIDEITDILESKKYRYVMYSGVHPNPRASEVMEGAELYTRENCDVIVAIGGGSPMDCAKGIGIVTSNKREIKEFEGVDKVIMPSPPLICIPTTAGSAADVSQFAIISDRKRMVKMAIISKKLVPDVALIDPIPTTTVDKYMTTCTGFDILSHAMEAYVSNASSPITDLHSIEAIKLFSKNIESLIDDVKDLNLRGNMMLASLHAGLAFSNASLGLVHAMAHSLGGFKDLPHGECNALLLEHVVNFNFDSEPERYFKIGKALGISKLNDKSDLIEGIKQFKHVTGVNRTLREIGVEEEDIPLLAERAMNDPCIVTNPKIPQKSDVEEIFKNAL